MRLGHRGIDIAQADLSDLLHEFFAAFLGVWASYVLTSGGFSLRYGALVLSVTILALYRMLNAFRAASSSFIARVWRYYAPTLLGMVIAVIGIDWAAIRFLPKGSERPSFEQILFLTMIMLLWITVFEIDHHRHDSPDEELQLWRQP
jgi:hypothetical protein